VVKNVVVVFEVFNSQKFYQEKIYRYFYKMVSSYVSQKEEIEEGMMFQIIIIIKFHILGFF
jgi:hypothetical protein